MRVLYILDPATIGGATKAFLNMVMELKAMGVTPIACTPKYNDLNIFLNNLGIQTIVTGHKEMITLRRKGCSLIAFLSTLKKLLDYLIHDYLAIRNISRLIDMHSIDIIHTNSTRSDIGFYLSKRYNKPHIVHVREFGDIDYMCYPLNPFYITLYNNYASAFLCVSNAVKSHWIKKGIDVKKTFTVYDGINSSNIVVSNDADKNAPILKLVMSGGIIPSKGQYLAIKAVGMLPYEIKSRITLDFIGWVSEEYRNELEQISKKSNIINPINYLGMRDDVLSLLRNYHVGLMCSKSEGFGLVTAEFMFAKLGVIASDSGASPELIENNVTGLIFSPGDELSLSQAIQKFFNDRELLIRLSSNAREKALKMFTSHTNAEYVYERYKDVNC